MAGLRNHPGRVTFAVTESLTSPAVAVCCHGHDVKSMIFLLIRNKVITQVYENDAGKAGQRRRKCFVEAVLDPVFNFQMLCQMA